MEIVLLIARLVLALVFGVAGIAKAADLAGSRRAMIGFGVPQGLASILGPGLPLVEILIAAALIPTTTAWLGAIAGLALLLIFCVGIAVNLARGNSPDCHCFGQLHSEPVKWSTFARNILLLAVAGLIVVQGRDNAGLSALNWLADMKAGEVVSLILGVAAVAFVAVAVVYLRRVLSQQATLLAKIDAMKRVIDEDYAEAPVERAEAAPPAEGLPIGAPAPDFSLATIGGEQVTLDDLLVYGTPVLLLFVSPNCVPCKTLLPAVKEWERDYRRELTIALLSKGDSRENQAMFAGFEVSHILLQGESSIAQEYEAQWTPAAVLINSAGRIASPITYGDDAIGALVTQAVTPVAARRRRSLPISGNGHKPQVTLGTPHALDALGERAPSFSLPDLDGRMVATEDFIGQDTLLLFWDPQCPYCRDMAEDCERFEEDPPKRAPRLVFVSSGNEDVVRTESERFKSQFLHDPEFDVGLLFGTNRTPSAVLIDCDGNLASGPTAGRSAIMALAGVRKTAAPVSAGV